MKTIHLTSALLCLCVASPAWSAPAPGPGSDAPAPDSGFTVTRLAPGVYAAVRKEPLGLINESNSLFIIGDTGVIVVDAQSSSHRTRETLAAFGPSPNRPGQRLPGVTPWHKRRRRSTWMSSNRPWRETIRYGRFSSDTTCGAPRYPGPSSRHPSDQPDDARPSGAQRDANAIF